MTRGRKPAIRPTRAINLHLDAELVGRIDALIWSEAEQRIPKGGYQAFFTEAAVRMMRQRPLDLCPYSGSMPSEHVAYAYPETQEVLRNLLEGKTNANDKP